MPLPPGTNVKQAKLACLATIEAANVYGMDAAMSALRSRVETDPHGCLYVVWNRGRGMEATLEIEYPFGGECLTIAVSWPTRGGYSPSHALACTALHQAVATIAATLEAQWAGVQLARE